VESDLTPELSARVLLEVPFHDVDALEVVWHGHYYKYFEIARTALLRSLHYDVEEQRNDGCVWPIVESSCRYLRPLRYGMKIHVTSVLREYEYRLVIDYVITDAESGERLTTGRTTQVAVDPLSGRLRFDPPQRIRDILASRSRS
jgi:acyl-CoA thioester hydrolase